MKIKRAIIIILILIWMVTVFMFSNQVSVDSDETSSRTVNFIINLLPNSSELTLEEREDLKGAMVPYIRKIAHYSIYTLGGILFICLMNTYEITDGKKILYSQLLGSAYAAIDEFHQLFIDGRSSEFKDILLDSIGVATGIIIGLIIYKIIEKIRLKRETKIA